MLVAPRLRQLFLCRQSFAAVAEFAAIRTRYGVSVALDPLAVPALVVVVVAPLLLRLVLLNGVRVERRDLGHTGERG